LFAGQTPDIIDGDNWPKWVQEIGVKPFVPVTEAALLGSGDAPCNEVNYGWVKLLTESRVQFDIVERDVKWEERYALVVLPENLWVDQALASRLKAFIAAGGAVMATHQSDLLAGTKKSWIDGRSE
jgi:hypothetical protein